MKSPLGARHLMAGAFLLVAVSIHSYAATVTVQVFNNFFSPATVSINVGDTVTWVFRSSGHDTVSDTGLWSSGLKPVNQTFSFTFNNAGSFGYFCTPHRQVGMVGTVNVQGAPPTVSLTSPGNGATFSTSETITFSANASDPGGSVTKVDFFRGGSTLIGTDNTSPYSITASLPAGTHSITARATDNGNLTATTTAITITVNAPNQAPTVSLTAPSNGATFSTTDTIIFSANASDDSGVSKVDFFSHGSLIGSDNSAPYSITATLAAGSHVITASATDNAGLTTTAGGVTITVNAPGTPPVITLTSPQAGKVIAAPGTVTLSATATDDGSIAQVQFFQGRGSVGIDTTAPYEAIVSDLGPGTYTFSATARDNTGLTETSASLQVRVVNAPQVGTIARDGNTITISASGTDGVTYDLEGTADFTSWSIVGTATASGGAVTFTDTMGPTMRFYRVVAR